MTTHVTSAELDKNRHLVRTLGAELGVIIFQYENKL